MGELKATTSGEIRTRHDLLGYWWYEKSEADKLIADLEESHKKEIGQLLIEIKRLENLCASYRHDCDNLAIREANALKEIGRDNRVIRHQKYKRCLTMAKWCRDKVDAIRNGYMRSSIESRYGVMTTCPPDCNPKFSFYDKWLNRWQELAEQFKDRK